MSLPHGGIRLKGMNVMKQICIVITNMEGSNI